MVAITTLQWIVDSRIFLLINPVCLFVVSSPEHVVSQGCLCCAPPGCCGCGTARLCCGCGCPSRCPSLSLCPCSSCPQQPEGESRHGCMLTLWYPLQGSSPQSAGLGVNPKMMELGSCWFPLSSFRCLKSEPPGFLAFSK